MAGQGDLSYLPFLIAACMVLTSIIAFPETCLRLWRTVLLKLELRKAARLARRQREVREKLKKYWVIETKDLRT